MVLSGEGRGGVERDETQFTRVGDIPYLLGSLERTSQSNRLESGWTRIRNWLSGHPPSGGDRDPTSWQRRTVSNGSTLKITILVLSGSIWHYSTGSTDRDPFFYVGGLLTRSNDFTLQCAAQYLYLCLGRLFDDTKLAGRFWVQLYIHGNIVVIPTSEISPLI